MNMKDWAKNEVKLACKREKEGVEDNDISMADYGVECYKSALRAFNSLCKDGHSGYSIGVTRAILNRLIDGKPLTPIEDVPEVWGTADKRKDEVSYQCLRMSSLFKTVKKKGKKVTYTDVRRVWCMDKNNPNVAYSSGLADRIIDEMFPIEMPYTAEKKYKVICEDCLSDPANGDFDTVAVHEVIITGPSGEERVKINRYFKEPEEGDVMKYPGWTEISRTTYNRRKKKHEERLAELEKEAKEKE